MSSSPASSSLPAATASAANSSRLVWSAVAPADLTALGAPGDESVWPRWRQTLAARAAEIAKGERSLSGATGSPAAWSDALAAFAKRLSTLTADELATELAALIDASARPTVDWRSPEPPAALRLVRFALALPDLASRLAAGEWLDVVERLAVVARDAASLDGDSWRSAALAWLAAELPLTLAGVAPELDEPRRLGLAGKREVERQLDDWLDGAGFPAAWALPWAIPLLACWTRCRAVLEGESAPAPWRDDADRQLADFAKVCLSLRRGDGRASLAAFDDVHGLDELFDRLAEPLGERSATLESSRVRAVRSAPTLVAKLTGATPPAGDGPATHSEWAEGAIMRTAWDRSAISLVARFDESPGIDLDLSSDRAPWFAGRWTFDATHDGTPLALRGGWDVVCWLDDAESLYLELEQELHGSGVRGRVQRQLLVAKKDRFALGIDVAFDLPPGAIQYSSSLPLATGTTAEVAERSVEVLLRSGETTTRWLPLSLPEWKRESPSRDWPAIADGSLKFRHEQRGRGCCYGWLVDLDAKRANEPFTWRRLTVAQERRIVGRDEAFGARVQIGKKFNWLIYRTLGKAENRTVLGKNLTSDFFCGRILKTGLTQVISEVEA